MPQYQKAGRSATSWRFSRLHAPRRAAILLALILVLTLPSRLVAGAAPAVQARATRPPASLPAQDPAPAQPGLELPILTPGGPGVSLHTHTVDIALAPADGLTMAVDLTARYRLHNDGKEPVAVTLQIPLPDANNLTLTAGDVPLSAQPQASGGLAAVVTVPVDAPVEVVLGYSTVIADSPIFEVRYPTQQLSQWPGNVSLRVDLRPAATMPPASWLDVSPADWAYAPPGVAPDPAVEWLYDGDPPDEIRFRALHPAAWQQVQQAEQAAAPGAAPAAFGALGDVYAGLAAAAQTAGPAAAARFFDQAVAAYTAGIRQGETNGAPATDLATLHAGLAGLYRSRVVGADGATNPLYAELMTREAAAALPGIMADDARRPELERWQSEGLRLLLTDARRRGDVGGALALIDRLSASGAADADFLAAERQALVVQQALELLERGDRPAALALAGDALADPALQPPANLQSLLTRWSITAAMTGAGIDLDLAATPHPDRVDAARAAFQAVIQGWNDTSTTRSFGARFEESAATEGASVPTLHLRVQLPAGSTGVALADALPAGADWALLRTLLTQLGPKLDSQANGLRQQVHVSQPVDLRAAGQQWEAMAATLENQATGLEQQAASTSGGETSTLAASLNSRIQAANFRHAAQAWRDLARDSFVQLSLAAGDAVEPSARTWLVTANSPPQMLDVQVESLSTGRVALAAAGLGLLLAGLAALLWRLMA